MMRRLLRLVLVLVSVLILVVLYFRITPLALGDTRTVQHAVCSQPPGMATQTQTSWRGSTLVLDVEDQQNCSLSLAHTATQRIGARLFVRAAYTSPEGVATGCKCGHKFSIELPNLPKQDYTVTVYAWP